MGRIISILIDIVSFLVRAARRLSLCLQALPSIPQEEEH